MRKTIIGVAIVVMALLAYGIASGAIVDGWLVEKTPPAVIGLQVSEGTRNDPDVDWLAPVGGLLQTVFFDNDPKCSEDGAAVIVASAVYVVPRAPIHNGNCNDTVQALWSSRTFDVAGGDVVRADMGGDSGHYWFYYATNTPSPEPPATNTATATNTPAPPDTPTATPVPTNTATMTPTATRTTVVAEPTSTPSPEPPEPAAACTSVTTVPSLPDALPPEGIVVDIYVEAVNPEGYTLVNGEYVLYFEAQPLPEIRIRPNEHYVVKVSETDKGCEIGVIPTGMAPIPQPPVAYTVRLPMASRP